jgi:membrane AbrB-like protein
MAISFDPRDLLAGVPPPALAATFALGAAGGLAGHLLGLPLGVLLGALLTVGAASAAGLRVGGHPLAVPPAWRFFLIPVIGVAIGASFTPALLAEAPRWALSMAALALYVPLVHWLGWLIYRRIGGLSPVTAYYSAIPGGLIESVQMGEDAGADIQMLTMLQFLRLIACIVLVPVVFTIQTGHSVGSAAGVRIEGADIPLGLVDAGLLLASAVGGVWLGRRLRLPAWIVTGPILASAAIHLAGLTRTVPPDWLIVFTQYVVGTSLGARFAGMGSGKLAMALRLSGIYAAMALGIAMLAAFALGGRAGEPAAAVFLAFAPGGIAEMTLVALSLQVSIVYVSAHHAVRIVLAVGFARLFAGRIRD